MIDIKNNSRSINHNKAINECKEVRVRGCKHSIYSGSAATYVHSPKLSSGVNPLLLLIAGSRETVYTSSFKASTFGEEKPLHFLLMVKRNLTPFLE